MFSEIILDVIEQKKRDTKPLFLEFHPVVSHNISTFEESLSRVESDVSSKSQRTPDVCVYGKGLVIKLYSIR